MRMAEWQKEEEEKLKNESDSRSRVLDWMMESKDKVMSIRFPFRPVLAAVRLLTFYFSRVPTEMLIARRAP